MPFFSHRDRVSSFCFAALKDLGVRTIIAFSAVVSLREEIARATSLCLRNSSIDRTKGRLAAWLAAAVQALKAEGSVVKLWTKKTLGGGDLIGMTALPEAEISFALIATSTDYDAWRPPEAGVTAAEVHKNTTLAYALPEYFKAP
ncbi:hypothetical protein B0H14DRAFT_3455457 [Mycena olivaceomarginata]|nr:hypothetical protein B0H14DRAFT_3455457 [Mycena olivaceomarginata]